MKGIITVKNLDFSYGEKEIFKNFSLSIKKSSFTTLIGNNGSGKTTLAKILIGKELRNAEIIINSHLLVAAVFNNAVFTQETVLDELAFRLENLHYNSRAISSKINKIAEILNIESLLDKKTNSLSSGEKQLIHITTALLIEPDILILDEALTLLDQNTKEKIYIILKEQTTKEKLTVVNITNDIEDTLFGNQVILIDHGKLILNGETKEILDNEKILNKYGYNQPFMHDLSVKLNYYGLLEERIYEIDKMVNAIWK